MRQRERERESERERERERDRQTDRQTDGEGFIECNCELASRHLRTQDGWIYVPIRFSLSCVADHSVR